MTISVASSAVGAGIHPAVAKASRATAASTVNSGAVVRVARVASIITDVSATRGLCSAGTMPSSAVRGLVRTAIRLPPGAVAFQFH
jgi:hypothetical protein